MPSARPKPWERQPGESAQAFHAFTLYRDMQGRSLGKVSKQLAAELAGFGNSIGDNGLPQTLTIIKDGQEQAISTLQKKAAGSVAAWSKRHRWVERAGDWDREVDGYIQRKRLDDVTRMRKRQAGVAEIAERMTAFPMLEFFKKANTPEIRKQLDQIPIYDLLGLGMEAAAKIPKIQEAERRANAVVLEEETTGAGHFTAKITVVTPNREPDRQILRNEEAESANSPWNGEDLAEED